jgi:putative DNA primase/helicase
MKMDYQQLAQQALGAARSLLPDWLPGGKVSGNEYICAGISGGKGRSFTVSLTKGVWKDFSDTMYSGGDLISLLAAIRNCSQSEAAKEIEARLGSVTVRDAKPTKGETWTPAEYVPSHAPDAPTKHWQYGEPAKTWEWRDAEGRLVGYTMRFNMPDGTKQFSQLTWGENRETGREKWVWKSCRKPRPLYRLPELLANPDAKVYVVEGEKCADHLTEYLRKNGDTTSLVTTWIGGSLAVQYADFTPLVGRQVMILPDNDAPGYQAAFAIRSVIGDSARIHWPREDKPEGWDVADCADDEELIGLLTHDGTPNSAYLPLYDGEEPDQGEELIPEPPKIVSSAQIQDAPFSVLGFDRGEYYFMSHFTHQVTSLTATGLTKANLLMLAPLNWWEDRFMSKGGPSWSAAANWLIQECHKRGIYSSDRLRGRGCWIELDGDHRRIVYHTGSDLIIDGEAVDISRHESMYIYERAACVMPDLVAPAGDGASKLFLRLAQSLNWKYPLMAHLFAGWCALAPICGVLSWRPHAWLSGPSSSGKSWAIRNIVRPMVGRLSVYTEGYTTEAGIRQEIGNDAMPIIIDEFESEKARDQLRVQEIVTLARSASSGDSAIIKGSANGKTHKFYVRAMFLFGSIGVAATQRADITRIASLELKEGDPDYFHQTIVPLAMQTVMRNGYCESLRARVLANAATIHKNIETFVLAVAEVVGDRRLGDQLGTLLAGAWSMYSTAEIDMQEAREWVAKHDWSIYMPARDEKDEIRALSVLTDAVIDVEDKDGRKYRRSIGEMLEYLANTTVPTEWTSVYPDALARHGIRWDEERIAVSNSHAAIRRIFLDTPWADKWKHQIKRLDGLPEGSCWISGGAHRVTYLLTSRFRRQQVMDMSDDDDDLSWAN